MVENEIIVLAGRDLFRMGVSLGFGATVGVFIAIGFYAIISGGGAKLWKMWRTS